MLTPPSSGSRDTAEEHEDGKDDLSGYGREEWRGDYGVRGEDTMHGWAAVGTKIVPAAATGFEGG